MPQKRGELIEVLRRTARTWRGEPAHTAHSAQPSVSRGNEAWPSGFERNAPYAATPDNRPAVLECGSLPLTRAPTSQISSGERAALEGILAQARPRIAVEIGTAEGGSLRRVANYSEKVHSIDVDHGPVGQVPANVQLHTGASTEMLPPLLAELASAGDPLGLALVDGGHSYKGVKRDLELLLQSPCTARTVILVHDTMNAEVRAGVESVSVESYPRVVYHELDFVPGYIARHRSQYGVGRTRSDPHRSPALRSIRRVATPGSVPRAVRRPTTPAHDLM